MPDAVRPSKESFERVLHRSRHTWSSFRDAHDGRSTLPTHCIDLRNILGKPQLLLATQIPAQIEFSVNAPFATWPNIEGIYHGTEDNHIAALFLAWAYILSARWAELLDRSTDHRCRIDHIYKTNHVIPESFSEYTEEAVADGFEEAQVFWWDAILAGNSGWKITAEYNQKTYLSPWSISIHDSQFIRARQITPSNHFPPPSSFTASEYLVRFCTHHQLYSQCSAALSAALCIPLFSGRLASLPVPKLSAKPMSRAQQTADHSSLRLISNYWNHLPYFMTLSSNLWGMRSLLGSTSFETGIECNLVSARLNPAFAVINPILENGNLVQLATILGRRRPQLAPPRSELHDIRDGLTAIDLHAAAWTGTTNSFISLKPGVAQEHTIRREDECRLLFITASVGYIRVPGSVWKPFGQTSISDTDLAVPEHAHCGCHCFEYHSWYWCFTDGEIEDPGLELTPSVGGVLRIGEGLELPLNIPCDNSLSEGETRSIFQWLRMSGYPASERAIYQHKWMDAGSSSEEEVDDGGSSSSPEFRGELVEA
ncbi:hypothetical protein BDV41DRAFT_589613 [Aspergillus transmontanensis]|uniref:Uncharacterized protein n=1 Tax=Aspergillus transmontanensis TaxID=1034304 RepID=A0A5N6WGC4_9EURO|nr:hypothetical protein BDV41DRAFT_589613 [Aspergillus transmontanensis]